MKSYYYMDCLHREIFLEEEDIQAVPESGRADEVVPPLPGSRMSWSSSWRTLSGPSKTRSAACVIPPMLKAATTL